MLGKIIVQGLSGILLLSAATMFAAGVQSGALQQKAAVAAPVVAAVDNTYAAPLDLF